MDGSVTNMEVDPVSNTDGQVQGNSTKPYIENLYSNEPKRCFHGVVELKFAVIGSERCKASVIEQGCVARLLQILRAPDSGLLLKTEVVTVLNSLAKGLPEHAASLVQAGVLPVLWEQLEACGLCNVQSNASQYVTKVTFNGKNSTTNSTSDNTSMNLNNTNNTLNNNSNMNDATNNNNNSNGCHKPNNTEQQQQQHKLLRIISNYTQILLCCLRSVYKQGCVPPPPSWNHKLLSTLIKYGYHPPTNQECVANILAYACKCEEQQVQLVDAGAGDLVAAMLHSSLSRVQLPALYCCTALAHRNQAVSQRLCKIKYNGVLLPDRLVELLGSHGDSFVQLAAAAALVWLHRGHALPHSDTRVCHKTLQCLVRLCAIDRPAWLRIEAGHELAHLTELTPELQKVASYTDHLISTITDFLEYNPIGDDPGPTAEHLSPLSCGKYDQVHKFPELMKESGLLVYASLAANNEEIRQKIIMEPCVVRSIRDALATGKSPVKLAAIRCLHSLSRSVHTLRTTFQDYNVWKPLLAIIQDQEAEDEMVVVALSTLCNLILEFSPSKERILEHGCISQLCSLTRKQNYDLKLNSVWALMNIAFQADSSVKEKILQQLGTDQVCSLVSQGDSPIVMKTLGLLRNLLSNKYHIDNIMKQHGSQIMQSVILILEGDHNTQVKEQALCILANIADGDQAKEFILGSEDVLEKLFNYMRMPSLELQLASTCCIANLANIKDNNAVDRLLRLREMKTEKLLDNLLSTQDPNLYDKVRDTLKQFDVLNTNSSQQQQQTSSSNTTVTSNTTTTTTTTTTNNSSSSSSSSNNSNGSSSSTPASHWRPLDQGQ